MFTEVLEKPKPQYPIPDPYEAELFQRCRRALNLSYEELAEALALGSDRTIRRWEKGEKDVPGPCFVAISYMLRDIGRQDLVDEINAP